MKKVLFVFNPNSGKGLIRNQLVSILQVLTQADYQVVVYPTKAPLDGYQMIKDHSLEYDMVICSGGDGMLNETVGAMLTIEKEKRLPIGYIPSGTTNDFATSLNIPKEMVKAAKNITEGELFSCDIGMMNQERSFNYVAAFGAFTEVSYGTPQSLKNLLGHQAYVLEGMKSLTDMKPIYMRIRTDDREIEGSYLYGMISNTESVGGVKGLTGREVNLQDGLFEVTLIRQVYNPVDLQQLMNAFLLQNLEQCPVVDTFRTSKITLESVDAIPWTLDGEYGGDHKKIDFSVLPKAVDFVVKPQKKTKENKVGMPFIMG